MHLESLAVKGAVLRLLWITQLLVLLLPSQAFSRTEHLVYFPDTAYELNVYKIYGKQPGKTLMLIGGIQGNEPGGFLSADLYADLSLEQGNLIVVPRANFYSIILNDRGPHGDMNRKFSPEDISDSMDNKIVAILKKLISESDYLLNLHDGSGYYYPTYINRWRNPMHFGQSIIADCEEYRVPGTDKVIRLGEMARRVIGEVNPHITNDLHKFHFMDTRTGDEDSPHSEQRKSATYYALTKYHIPAFGVETSKFLPSIDLKVIYHNLVINAFRDLFGIVPQSPGLILDVPVLKYIVVSINGQVPIVINQNQTLELLPGDTINVSHIEANYERGLSLDILGYGDLNDYRREFAIFRDTSIIVRKDNHKFAAIPVKMSTKRLGEGKRAARPSSSEKIDYFVIEIKNERLLFSTGETVDVVRGDSVKIADVLPSIPALSAVKVNFKGFVGDKKDNTGEDRGYVIDTGKDLMQRFSVDKKGETYEIIASDGDKVLGRLYVKLVPPKMDYVILKVNHHKHLFLRSEDAVSLSKDDEICVEEIRTNLYDNTGIHLNINGHKISPGDTRELAALWPHPDQLSHQVEIKKGPLVLGKIFINLLSDPHIQESTNHSTGRPF